jgi:hypothetical protein
MLLTKRELRTILRNWRVKAPAELQRKLLEEYGKPATDDEGHIFEYTEQDICEQMRKRLLTR